jgi:hypothetical protein
MNINSPFEQWRLKYMQGKAASGEIMELLALAFEEGRAVSKPWVGLTDEDIDDVTGEVGFGYIDVARAIEAKLKEKNT